MARTGHSRLPSQSIISEEVNLRLEAHSLRIRSQRLQVRVHGRAWIVWVRVLLVKIDNGPSKVITARTEAETISLRMISECGRGAVGFEQGRDVV